MLFQVIADALMERWSRRGWESNTAALQDRNILVGSLRAVEIQGWRFGDMWLSGEWHVLPGSVRLASTTVVVDSVDDQTRAWSMRESTFPGGIDAVVLTLRGPRGVVEIAMAATSESWFREAVVASA